MGPRSNTDAVLVARAREGDLQAFERLVTRHRSRAYEIARQITHDAEAAQDVTQEALLQAFRSLEGLRDGERFGPWLNTIVRRQAQRWARDGRYREEPLDHALLLGSPVGMWAVSAEGPSETVDLIRGAVAALTQRERRIMVLHYLEGYSCNEIASKLGLATGSVKRLLHNSRRKVRQEVRAMAEAEQTRKGPRRLRVWINGSVPEGDGNVFYHVRPGIAQAICLAVNKEAKTAQQIAEQVKAHVSYVSETLDDLTDMTVLTAPGKGSYLANFIAFDAEDWRRVMRSIPEPAAEAAHRFASVEGRLKAAFERTPLAASGWHWADVIWVVYSVLVANAGVSRAGITGVRPAPARPRGGSYWLGGHEIVPDLPSVWTTGLNSDLPLETMHLANFWTYQIERDWAAVVSTARDRAKIVELLAKAPVTETEALTHFGDEGERGRVALADLVKTGLARRQNGRYRIGIPVFTEGDSDVLTPEVDGLMKPVVADVVIPALRHVDSLLDEMGYGPWRGQYPEWHRWLAGNITGHALSYLVEQGVLPRPPSPAPPNFATLAWRKGISLVW
jgi:RNA polymerase sigma-70 factor (ECF subfamily)